MILQELLSSPYHLTHVSVRPIISHILSYSFVFYSSSYPTSSRELACKQGLQAGSLMELQSYASLCPSIEEDGEGENSEIVENDLLLIRYDYVGRSY